MKYFTADEDYPGAKLLNGCVPGTFYCYVPSNFLNGIVPLTEVKAAVVLERYRVLKRDRITTLTREAVCRTRLSETFRDDVILLCQRDRERQRTHSEKGTVEEWCSACSSMRLVPHSSEKQPDEWWLFWYDCDTSDCCVGRFVTNETAEQVKTAFLRWVAERTEKNTDQRGVARSEEDEGATRDMKNGLGWERMTDWMELPADLFRHGALWVGW